MQAVPSLRTQSVTTDAGTSLHIIEGPIAFIALQNSPPCFARAWTGYLAREKLIESAALAELVRDLSRSWPLNMSLAREIAAAVSRIDGVLGAAACLQSLHVPTRRGETADEAGLFAWRGLYNFRPAVRRQFMDRCVYKSA